MFEHIRAILHRIAQLTVQSLRRKRLVTLELLMLEERAVPAVNLLYSYDPPPMVAVAELPPAAIIYQEAAAPIVRVDFMATESPAKTTDVFDEEWEIDGQERGKPSKPVQPSATKPEETDANSSQDTVCLTEEELAHATLNEELRREAASVGA